MSWIEPTRTMKNSSKFDWKIDRKDNRSQRGIVSSAASSNTRSLNFSQESSRLIKHF